MLIWLVYNLGQCKKNYLIIKSCITLLYLSLDTAAPPSAIKSSAKTSAIFSLYARALSNNKHGSGLKFRTIAPSLVDPAEIKLS
jgi:hypothetical protein